MRSEDRVELICMTVSGVRIVLAALCAAGLLAHLVLGSWSGCEGGG